MIAHNFFGIDRDIHGTHDRTRAVGFTGQIRALNGKEAKQIRNSKHRPIGTGIFTPGAFHKNGEYKCNTKNGKGTPCHFGVPEIE
jgi:hypothetical protein